MSGSKAWLHDRRYVELLTLDEPSSKRINRARAEPSIATVQSPNTTIQRPQPLSLLNHRNDYDNIEFPRR